jgi:hypothetical protein
VDSIQNNLGAFFATPPAVEPPPAVEANLAAIKRPPPTPFGERNVRQTAPQKTGLCGAPRFRAPAPPAAGANLAVTKVPIESVPLRGKKIPAGVAAPHPSNPSRTNRVRLHRKDRRGSAPPLDWYFVIPGSGARRATEVQQHAQRFACLIGRILCVRTGCACANESPCASRPPMPRIFVAAGSEARHRADPCKTGFRGGSPRYRNPTTRSTFRVPYRASPLLGWF